MWVSSRQAEDSAAGSNRKRRMTDALWKGPLHVMRPHSTERGEATARGRTRVRVAATVAGGSGTPRTLPHTGVKARLSAATAVRRELATASSPRESEPAREPRVRFGDPPATHVPKASRAAGGRAGVPDFRPCNTLQLPRGAAGLRCSAWSHSQARRCEEIARMRLPDGNRRNVRWSYSS
jgi:hypothetical protein